MTEQTISKNGIVFLSRVLLTFTIKHLEDEFPGWWWSVSQHVDSVTITAGPSKNCPHLADVWLSETRMGDKGFSFSFYYKDISSEELYLNWLVRICDMLKVHRSVGMQHVDILKVKILPTYRRQKEIELKNLADTYAKFLDEIELYEKNGMIFNEVYLGSCEFSVDCSLRGIQVEGEDRREFDFTCDISEVGYSIASSFEECILDLKHAVVSPETDRFELYEHMSAESAYELQNAEWTAHVARMQTQP